MLTDKDEVMMVSTEGSVPGKPPVRGAARGGKGGRPKINIRYLLQTVFGFYLITG
jgi:hypothetical protein